MNLPKIVNHNSYLVGLRNGRGMVLGGQSATLAVFLLDDWALQKLIALPDRCKGIKQLEFVPRSFDGGANKVGFEK